MEVKDVVVRSEPKVKYGETSEKASVSVWFIPEKGDSFPVLMLSDGLTLSSGGNIENYDSDNQISIIDDLHRIGDDVKSVYEGSQDPEDYNVMLDNKMKTYALSLIYSSVIMEETSSEVLYCLGIGTDFSTGNKKLDNLLSEAKEDVESRDSYSFDKYVDLSAYHSSHNSEESTSLWGVNSNGKEECIFFNFPENGVMPVSPEVKMEKHREVVSQDYYNLLFKVLAHSEVQGSAIDGNIFLSEDDEFSDEEYANFYKFLMVLQDSIERGNYVTEPLQKMFDLVGQRQDEF